MRSLVKIIVNGAALVSLTLFRDIQYYEKETEKLKRIGYKEPKWKYQRSTVRDGKKDGVNWYILEPRKGFQFHTWEFVKGYVNGFCSVSLHSSSDAD